MTELTRIQTIAGGPQESTAPATATDPRSLDPRSLDERIADAVDFRSAFGFPSDVSTVTALLDDPTADLSFGAPLSAKELANMQDRLAARAKADAAIAYVDGRPNDFGGAYFTQNTGNLVLYVLPAEGIAPGILDSAIALVPEGLETKVQAVKTSMAELVQAEQRLLLRRDELQINELAIQVKENGLEMVLAPTAKASLSAGLAAVPVAISFGPGPQAAVCNDSSSCTPYRGGIGIFSPQANEFCTWGFLQVQVTDGVDRNTFDAGASAISDSMTAQSRRSY